MSESAAPAAARGGSRALLSIQILRAVAALGVLLHHTAHEVSAKTGVNVPFGEFVVGAGGVDLFFVISGFVMVYASERLFAQPEMTKNRSTPPAPTTNSPNGTVTPVFAETSCAV